MTMNVDQARALCQQHGCTLQFHVKRQRWVVSNQHHSLLLNTGTLADCVAAARNIAQGRL